MQFLLQEKTACSPIASVHHLFQCLVFEDVIHETEMTWKGLKFSEHLVNCGRVSLHIYHDCGGTFPEPMRMVPYIKAFCRLNHGEEAIYQGKVHGTKPVHVVAPRLVDDLPIDEYPTDGPFEISVELREDHYYFMTNMPNWFMLHFSSPLCGESYPPLFSSNYDVNFLIIRQIMSPPKNPSENEEQ
ncbi:uncharacterized protein LOC144100408 [Amblyomma americanum]